jgi:arylsulfatase A-like enzyme
VGHAGKWHVGRHRGPSHYGIEGEHMPGALNPFHHEAYRAWLEARGYPPFRAADGIFTEAHNRSGRGHLLAGRLEQPFEATIESYITEQALGLLDRYARDFNASGKPFMLTASFFGPHLPYLIPDAWFDLYDPADVTLPASFAESFAGKPDVQRRYSEYWGVDGLDDDTWRKLIAVYWGYVSMIDRCVGRLLDALDAHGLWGSTNIVFVADHGEFTGAHRLNDKGPAMYEDIYRVPAFIRVPGLPAQRCDAFASLVDLAPTFLEMAGVPVSQQGDGRSLMPLLRGESPVDWRSEIVAEFHGHHFSYAQRMIRDRRHKLVFNPESINELYDLAEDPHELRNVHDVPGYRGVRDDLTERLYRELVARGDPAFTWMTYMAPIGSARVGDIDGVADHVDRHG